MFKNYLTIAFRNIFRYRLYSFLNIVGLTIGISSFILLFLNVKTELSFDQHLASGKIYRVIEEQQEGDQESRLLAQSAPVLAEKIRQDFPEIKSSTRVWRMGSTVNSIKERPFAERNWVIADPGAIDIFGLEFEQGDPEKALNAPNSVIMTRANAQKYFGAQNPIGKTLENDRFGKVTIRGIFKPLPLNSHFQADVIYSYSSILNLEGGMGDRFREVLSDWNRSGGGSTYLKFKKAEDAKGFDTRLQDYLAKHRDAEIHQTRRAYLQALEDIHFNSTQIESGLGDDKKGDFGQVQVFSTIALFMLLIAGINYVNLSTARSTQRAKEIGVRKVVGANKTQLIIQFLSEALIFCFLAFILGIALSELSLPYFSEISGYAFSQWDILSLLPQVFGVIILLSILAGLYPAFVLSAYKPSKVLRGQIKSMGKLNLNFRQVLVLSQFCLSIIMMIATLIAFQQLNYIQNKDKGFDEKNLVIVDINSQAARENYSLIKQELLQFPQISQVSAVSRVPGEWKNIVEMDLETPGQEASISSYFFGFDPDALSSFGIELIQGRNFREGQATDSAKVLINERMAKALGFENPLGKKLIDSDTSQAYEVEIIGVVKDFHFQSMHEKIQPLVIGNWNNTVQPIDYYAIRYSSQDTQVALNKIQAVYEKFDPNTPIEYNFLADQIANMYQKDRLAGKVFGIGALLTILIASLGLFGLASFMLQKKSKEIAIRKILGANIFQIFYKLTRVFLIPVALAFILAIPIAYYFAEQWLNNFAYRIPIQWFVFALVAVFSILITLVTVSLQTLQVARSQPIEALNQE